jgi:hypothetical protein
LAFAALVPTSSTTPAFASRSASALFVRIQSPGAYMPVILSWKRIARKFDRLGIAKVSVNQSILRPDRKTNPLFATHGEGIANSEISVLCAGVDPGRPSFAKDGSTELPRGSDRRGGRDHIWSRAAIVQRLSIFVILEQVSGQTGASPGRNFDIGHVAAAAANGPAAMSYRGRLQQRRSPC